MASAGSKSGSKSGPKSGSKADFTPCGAFAEKMEEKLKSLHIHPLHNASEGRKYSIKIDKLKRTVSVNIYDIVHKKEGSKHTVTIDSQMTYIILCDKRTFFTAGVSDADVTRYLKDDHLLTDITGKPQFLGGRRSAKRQSAKRQSAKHRSAKHRSAKRRSTKRHRSTRKN